MGQNARSAQFGLERTGAVQAEHRRAAGWRALGQQAHLRDAEVGRRTAAGRGSVGDQPPQVAAAIDLLLDLRRERTPLASGERTGDRFESGLDVSAHVLPHRGGREPTWAAVLVLEMVHQWFYPGTRYV